MTTAFTAEMQIRTLIEATENWHQLIEDASVERPTWFNSMIPRGIAELGKGYERQKWRSHADMVEQSGMLNWREVVRGRAPGTGYTTSAGVVVPPEQDPGYDPCTFVGDLVSYNFQKVTYKMWESGLRTADICIHQVMNDWEFMQQVDAIFAHLPEFTLQRWDNATMEYYMYMSSVNGNMLVLGGGSPFQYTADYDPFVSKDITITAGPDQMSALELKSLRQIRNRLTAEAPSSASANANGYPVWPLIIDGDDFEDWLDAKPEVREDVRYAVPNVNIQGYGALDSYRKWALQHRPNMPRYKIKTQAAGSVVLERVDPYDETSVFIGNRRTFSQAYQDAPIGMGIIFLKDTFKLLIPPVPSTAGGGTKFSTSPSMGGEFVWNQYKSDTDVLGRKGKFLATFQAWFEPLKWYDKAVTFLYARCISNPARLCEPCGSDVGTGEIDVVANSAELTDGTASSKYVTLTLASCLPCEGMAAVTVHYSTDSTVAGFIINAGNAPTYELYLATAGAWDTDLATGATVECGATAR